MEKIKKGDIVGRKSHGNDILFIVDRMIPRKQEQPIVILKGLIIRIEADAPIDDLVIMETKQIEKNMRSLENKIEDRMKQGSDTAKEKTKLFGRNFLKTQTRGQENGTILHLDGDSCFENKNLLR